MPKRGVIFAQPIQRLMTMKSLVQYSPLLEKVMGVAALTTAIAFGVLHLINTASEQEAEEDLDEVDTTDYLLRSPNRERLLAAIERDRKGLYVQYDLIEA